MKEDLICFCHLRWDFVYQRPQHLLSRFAKQQRVFVIEEPLFNAPVSHNEIKFNDESDLWVIVPHIKYGVEQHEIPAVQKELLDGLLLQLNIKNYITWYYSPMAWQFSQHLQPRYIIYDCMDELSAFKFAPAALKPNEAALLKRSDLVFTGGYHLYEAKQQLHHNIHPFPSSIDKQHFAAARNQNVEPADQASIPYPRIGFYGVVDERFDIDLLNEAALARPGWQFVVIGPVVKIDEATLPRHQNVHYLGGKTYKALPTYLAGWDIAMMPFALNESTKFISPTKTPEYLAGGKPVISTSIRDVVMPYGDMELVHIADSAPAFIQAAERIFASVEKDAWLEKVDAFLEDNSWDITWNKMNQLIRIGLSKRVLTTSMVGERKIA